MTYRGPAVLLSGPAGTGKSRACLEKLHAMMLATPRARGLIVRKTAESVTSTALVTWREWVATEAIDAGLMEFYGGSSEEPPQYRYTNGSRVMIGGMNKPTKIMSSEYDVIYVQEAIELTITDWEALETRLRNGRVSFQQLIADTNPDIETHWLNQRANDPAAPLLMMESRHVDNPRLYTELADGTYEITPYGVSYMARLDALTGMRRMRLRDGVWGSTEHQVYDEWDPSVHLVDAFPIPEHWPRRWSIDFGYAHPFVCTMWARDDDGGLVRYREHYRTGQTVEDMAEQIMASVRQHDDRDPLGHDWPAPDPEADGERPPGAGRDWVAPARTSCRAADHWKDPFAQQHYIWTEPQPEAILCDHDADGRETFTRLTGLPTEKADKRVDAGIDLVKQRFKEPGRIRFLRGALVSTDTERQEAHRPTCTEEEIPGYRRDPRTGKPVKIDDDGCDTVRYVVVYEDLTAGGVNVRWLD